MVEITLSKILSQHYVTCVPENIFFLVVWPILSTKKNTNSEIKLA